MKKTVVAALILISIVALGWVSERPIWVHSETEVAPSASFTVAPNPTGIGFSVSITVTVQPAGFGATAFTLNVTRPDGTYQVLSPFGQSVDQNSNSLSYQYTPTEIGNFTLTFTFSGGSFNNTVVYLPCENQTILTVTQNPYPSASPSLSPTPSPSSERQFRVIGKIPVGDMPSALAYDSSKGELFVANQNDDTVSVISNTNNTVIATIPVGVNPTGVAYDLGKGEIFVTNMASDTVSVISDRNNTVIATIPIIFGNSSTNPTGIAYDSGKGEIFVTDDVDIFSVLSGSALMTENDVGMVSVISDSNNKVVATIPVGYDPAGVAYDSGKGEIFVATEANYPTFTGVWVISDSNNTVIANIPVGNSPEGVAYDSGTGEVFVTNSGDNTTSVISDSTNKVIVTLAVGNDPQGVAYDSGKGEIFVANHGSNTVSVISATNNTVIADVNGTSAPQGLAYDSGKSELFVTSYFGQLNFMLPPTLSHTVLVISDFYPLAAPLVSPSLSMMVQGESANLTSEVTTGALPYLYQWFIEIPNAPSFSPISNATSSSYDFSTSTSTATGNWTFMLQVTDGTGATANSTATQITVTAPTPPPAINLSGLGAKDLAAAAVAIILAAAVTAVLLLRKKGTEKRIKKNQT